MVSSSSAGIRNVPEPPCPRRRPRGGSSSDITTPRRLGALALIATIGLSGLLEQRRLDVARASVAAPTTAPSAARPRPASGSAAPSCAAAPMPPTGIGHAPGCRRDLPGAALRRAGSRRTTALYSNVQIDYQANGSGAGIKAITEQTVDFGASDAAMKDERDRGPAVRHQDAPLPDRPRRGRRDLQPAGHRPSSSSTRPTSPGIYLGKITKWNDPAIAANNAGVTLPDRRHRSSSTARTARGRPTPSRPTSTRSTRPGTRPSGAGKEVKWPIGIGASGNDGVATAVKQTPGAIGYVELNYASATQADLGLRQERGRRSSCPARPTA